MGGKAGGIFGLVIAIVLVIALAGTPFYLGLLQSPERRLDDVVSPNAEIVRRAIANLDHELAVLSYMYTSADSDGLDRSTAAQIGRDHPDLFTGAAMRDLEKATGVLTAVSQRDTQRGTTIPDRSGGLRGTPSAEAVVQQVSTELKSPEKVLRQAETAMNALRSASAGGLSATNHLDANRVRALFLLMKARAEMDRATFENSQAAVLWAAAEKRLLTLENLRSRLKALEIQSPDALIEMVKRRIERAEAGTAQLQQAIAQIGSIIESRETELEQLEDSASAAHEALQSLDVTRLGFDAYRSRYEELSRMAREAESHAAAIQNGTLRGAKLVTEEGAEPSVPQYEDGMGDPGLGVLRFRLEQFQEQAENLRQIQEEATREMAGLRELSQRLEGELETLNRQVQSETTALKGLLKEAATHVEAAGKADEESLKHLKDATGATRSAITAAKKRTTDAAALARSGEKVDELQQRVSQDIETEAYLHTLAGQVGYNSALVRFARIHAAASHAEIASLMAGSVSGIGSAPQFDTDAVKTEAVNDLAEAIKSFEQAATLIGRINVRFPDNTTASGKNYVWQAQLGQAACHLLHAALVADDREASFEQQMLAYNILKEAVEKREQSPLLASAVDTLLYLQQNAR